MNDLISVDALVHDQAITMILADLKDVGWREPEGGGQDRENYVKNVKQHTEIRPNTDKRIKQHSEFLQKLVFKSKVVQLVAQPKSMRYFQFNHYAEGENYNWHSDSSHMGSLRTDFTCVIGMSDPDSYEGGDHLFMEGGDTTKVRIKKGQALLYPSGVMHKVEPVTKGTRIVAISWMQSWVQNAAHRAIMIEAIQLMLEVNKAKRKDGKMTTAQIRMVSLISNLKREFHS